MKMSKRFFGAILFLITMLFLSGCMRQGRAAVKDPDISDMEGIIKNSFDISDMTAIDANRLKKLYDIDPAELDGFFAYVSSSNLKASEIALLKVKDVKALKGIKEKVEERVKRQSHSFKDYLPEEYGLLEGHVLTTKENYILLAVSKEAEKIQTAFNSTFK